MAAASTVDERDGLPLRGIRPPRPLGKAAGIFLICLIGFVALPAGSVANWAWCLAALIIARLIVGATFRGDAVRVSFHPLLPTAILIKFAIFWIALQGLASLNGTPAGELWANAGSILGRDVTELG